MSTTQLIEKAQYLVDSSGNKTSVLLLLNLHDWEKLLQAFNALSAEGIDSDFSATPLNPSKNPLLTEFAGSVSIGSLASNIDEELYGPVRVS